MTPIEMIVERLETNEFGEPQFRLVYSVGGRIVGHDMIGRDAALALAWNTDIAAVIRDHFYNMENAVKKALIFDEEIENAVSSANSTSSPDGTLVLL